MSNILKVFKNGKDYENALNKDRFFSVYVCFDEIFGIKDDDFGVIVFKNDRRVDYVKHYNTGTRRCNWEYVALFQKIDGVIYVLSNIYYRDYHNGHAQCRDFYKTNDDIETKKNAQYLFLDDENLELNLKKLHELTNVLCKHTFFYHDNIEKDLKEYFGDEKFVILR